MIAVFLTPPKNCDIPIYIWKFSCFAVFFFVQYQIHKPSLPIEIASLLFNWFQWHKTCICYHTILKYRTLFLIKIWLFIGSDPVKYFKNLKIISRWFFNPAWNLCLFCGFGRLLLGEGSMCNIEAVWLLAVTVNILTEMNREPRLRNRWGFEIGSVKVQNSFFASNIQPQSRNPPEVQRHS